MRTHNSCHPERSEAESKDLRPLFVMSELALFAQSEIIVISIHMGLASATLWVVRIYGRNFVCA